MAQDCFEVWINQYLDCLFNETAFNSLQDTTLWIMLVWSHIDTGKEINRKISNIKRALVDNKFGDHSDVVGISPVGAAPTTSSFQT